MNAKCLGPTIALLTFLAIACDEATPPLEPLPPRLDVSLQIATGRIAFVTNRDGNFEIYVMNPDGSGQTNITNSSLPDFQPAWSPDGSRIAFSRIDENGNQNVWVMNADGTGQQKLNSVDGGEPGWSPDGSRIAFTSFSPTFTDFEIHVMNANGTGDVNITNHAADDFLPSWSPDGQWLVFSSNGSNQSASSSTSAPTSCGPDGSDVTRLTTFPGSEFVARWAPDGGPSGVHLSERSGLLADQPGTGPG